MTGYVALWHGGSSYSHGEWATDAFHVATIADAVEYLRSTDRGRTHRADAIEWDENGAPYRGAALDSIGTPCVDADASVILAPMSATLEDLERDTFGGAASHLIELGPRGGVKVTRV